MEAIRCQGLTKHYGSVIALDGLDLVIPESGAFGFLGLNGAGKRTSMKLLTGLATPSAGKAWVAGVGPDSLSLRSKISQYSPAETIGWGLRPVSGVGGSAWLALTVTVGTILFSMLLSRLTLKRQDL